MSKRTGALSLRALRADGLEPMAVASLAVRIGMSGQVEARSSLDDLACDFHPSDASRSAARFSEDELRALNADLVHDMPYAEAAERLRAIGVGDDVAERFWLATRANCEVVGDAEKWWRAVSVPPFEAVPEEDRDFVREAFDVLHDGEITDATWSEWVAALKARTDRKGKRLFMPLRLALTGLDHGPELAALLPLIGREGMLARRP